jgi:Terminase RNaseH-like domain
VSIRIEDLGYGPSEEELEEMALAAEAEADAESIQGEDETFIVLDPEMANFVDELVKRTILFCEELWGEDFYPYQRPVSYRIVESLILQDAEEITGLLSRQSGKSEVVATTLAGCMILFPILAKTYPILERFKHGVWVGLFAPVDEQSEIVYRRLIDRLTSERAAYFLQDPEIATKIDARSRELRLSNGSRCKRQTANPRAKIEGSTYHIIVVDEAQDSDELVVRKSIHPMLASTGGSMVKIGTPGYHKGDFYKAINLNKRRARGKRTNHFEYDYKIVGKYNPAYKLFVEKEKFRLGEDSEEFQMSYCLRWQLERGMLITEDDLDMLADKSMPLLKAWHRTPCVVGIDPARVKDSTVVTVMWVDWDHPDPAGYREHRVLNWLEIHNTAWEEQYFQICEFLDPYVISHIAVDAQGMGSAVADRLQRLMGSRCEVMSMNSDAKTQSERWKHLIQLLQRQMLIYPGHSKARRTRVWRRFRQQMSDAEKVMKGQHLLIEAPNEREAHDDYVDSAALACACTLGDAVPLVEVIDSPFFR